MPAQGDWAWCNKCQALGFAGSSVPGHCKAGGNHDYSGSGGYWLVQNEPKAVDPEWYWCNKCQLLIWTEATPPKCTVGNGYHDYTGTGHYYIFKSPQPGLGQDNWRFCHKCSALTFAASATLGPCAFGGHHQHLEPDGYITGSNNFTLAQTKAQAKALIKKL
jgi:hypothetical protein